MESHLDELDRVLGPVAVMSLSQRGLIPHPGSVGVRPGWSSPAERDRIAGAIVGAAIGSAIGLPHEWERRAPHLHPGEIAVRLARTAYGADVQLLVRSVYAWLETGLSSGQRLAELLVQGPRLRNPGRATRAAIGRLHAGSPWFEAGVPSFGNGALVRATAFGLLLPEGNSWRPIAVALNTVVTHADRTAVAVGVAAADIIALLAGEDMAGWQPTAWLDRVAARLPMPLRRGVADVSRRVTSGGPAPESAATAEGALTAALYHFATHRGDPAAAIISAGEAGGDTDTVAALTGAMAGAAWGLAAIPQTWVEAFCRTPMLLAAADRIAHMPDISLPVPTHRQEDDEVHIHFLLDRSGSMAAIADDVIGGFNSFLAQQRLQAGRCRLTLAQFDSQDPFEILVHGLDLARVPDLDGSRYQPRGGTPLYDAMGSLLDLAETEAVVARNVDRLVVVFSDGLENASRRWDRGAIFRRVSRLQEMRWTFVFLGANQDSYAEGGALGIAPGSTSNFRADSRGTSRAWESVNRAMASWRGKTSDARRMDSQRFFEDLKEAEQEDR